MAERFVMLAIADNADDAGFAFPGVEVIAGKSCQSVRNTLRVLKQLEKSGWLMVKRRCQGPKKQGNGYQLNLLMMAIPSDKVSVRKPHDTVSSRTRTSVATKDTSNAPSDTLSPDVENESRGDKSAQSEVTSASKRSDKTAFPILKNHQEPSLEPKSLPLPLSGVKNNSSEDDDAKANERPATRGLSAAEHLLRELVPAAHGEPAEGIQVDSERREAAGPGLGDAPCTRPTLPVKPLVGKRTAQEILDHFRVPEKRRGGDFESIAEIIPATNVKDWRAGFNGVLHDIHDALFQTSLNIGTKGHPNLTDGADEWRECFESATVADYDADPVSGTPMLVVTSANPAKTAAAFKKYSKRMEAGMEKYFGQVVQISVRSEA
jgi:hypothetical protein